MWRRGGHFSGAAEEPSTLAGASIFFDRRPSIALVDEILSGSYRGDARESWKRRCRAGIRRAEIVIVNDTSRVDLVHDYAGLPPSREVLVYPGGYLEPPAPVDRAAQRASWTVPDNALLVGFSGGFNLTAGADWLVESTQSSPDLHARIQPLGIDDMTQFLLPRLPVETRRLGWREAWSQAATFDVGMAVYLNPAPQFQHMGTSSNRLCMFLAMGVPVIASRQESFRFLEEYDCGVLVEDSGGFTRALQEIVPRLPEMKGNAKRCWREHVATQASYAKLATAVRDLVGG